MNIEKQCLRNRLPASVSALALCNSLLSDHVSSTIHCLQIGHLRVVSERCRMRIQTWLADGLLYWLVQAAVHDCLCQAIAQYCRIVGRDSSDTGDFESECDECMSSLGSEPDPDALACASEHTAGRNLCIMLWEYMLNGHCCRSGCMYMQQDVGCMLGNPLFRYHMYSVKNNLKRHLLELAG